jgi:ribosomal protein S14
MPPRRRNPVSLGRHRRNCSVCAHPEKFDIEAEFVAWRSPAALALQYGVNRAAIYRHSHAFNLFSRRRHNLRSALERLIERVDEVEVTASAVVSAVIALARINAEGGWVEPSERVSLHELFGRMSRAELQTYAETGKLPGWFPASVTTDALTTGAKNA